MGSKLGIAVLGCGHWGVNYVRVLNELAEVGNVVVCEQRADRLEEISRRFPGVTLTTQIEEALQTEGVDAAVICTQATSHYDVARRCIEAGKHLLVEKPLTTNAEEAEDIISLAESRELVLMVGHTFLHNMGIRKVKEYIDEGSVGKIYYLYSRRTNLGPIRQDVNSIWDLASHDVSIFDYLLGGAPEWVSAVGTKVLGNAREDVGFISLGYPDDIVGHIHVSWADPMKVREIVLVSSTMRIVFDDLNAQERVRVFEKSVVPVTPETPSFGEYQLLVRDGDIVSPQIEVSEPLKNQCKCFIECIQSDSRPHSDGLKGLEVVRVMEAIDRSVQLAGSPVQVK